MKDCEVCNGTGVNEVLVWDNDIEAYTIELEPCSCQ